MSTTIDNLKNAKTHSALVEQFGEESVLGAYEIFANKWDTSTEDEKIELQKSAFSAIAGDEQARSVMAEQFNLDAQPARAGYVIASIIIVGVVVYMLLY